jgi:hypothetical protein
MSSRFAISLAAIAGCASPGRGSGGGRDAKGGSPDGGAPDSGLLDSGADPGPPLQKAAVFAVIADTHITRPGDAADRLAAAVAWLSSAPEAAEVELVLILGDIAWGEGFGPTLEALAPLALPWVPVMGDNVIQAGEEARFQAEFGPQLEALAGRLPGFTRAPSPVDGPAGEALWLHNFAFDLGPARLVVLDWNSRELHPLYGETPDLFDLPGGTLPFLRAELAAAGGARAGSRVLFSHMPMFFGPGGFDVDEAPVLIEALDPAAGHAHTNLCGHLHGNGAHRWDEAGLDVVLTDAVFDDVITVRTAELWANDRRVELRTTAHTVPWPPAGAPGG